ncbi:MAG: putative toxin-antitoxin system toxin component, PIN family [Burkholderiaceae bacterium]|nr:putative toxin-antitoxin system toxin component, PIN family [Burkholderiaceae bacterium]
MSTPIVLDTNVVLDLLVFDDPATPTLQQALSEGALRWIATPVMREELARVLLYPHIVARLDYYRLGADDVLAAFDRQVQRVDVAPRAPMVCRDPDDQKFIDLAVAHRAALLSKDHAVLKLRKRLTLQGVPVATRLDALPALEPLT